MSPLWTVCWKEVREMARDKRVVYSAILGPVILIFLFLFLFGFLKETVTKPKSQTLHVVSGRSDNLFVEALRKSGTLDIREVDSVEEGRKLLSAGKAKVVLLPPEDFDAELAAGQTVTVEALFDPDQQASEIVLAMLEKTVSAASREAAGRILETQGLPKELADPIRLERKPIKVEKEEFGSFLAGLLPYLIVIWAFYGGFSVASDLVAGEKERSTLETLLISPVARNHLVGGKFVALWILCFVSSIVSVLAVVLAAITPIPLVQSMFPQGIPLSPLSVVAIVTVQVPLAAAFAGVLLAVSVFARNMREAQSYLSLLSFVVLMPALFSQFIGYTSFAKALWVSLVPILNSATVLREGMLGNFSLVPYLLTMGVNVALAAASLIACTTMFRKERIVWRV
ncbi:MAG: ABC transporter permease [Fimbriimonadaceae bacterium]|nr:MAG: ABC transporter permease [Armatimonadota bacterium]MCC6351023.1 ABC transporter permease [Fimbriimonadaceae bacterium]MCL4283940.1 ABC transporter permease [Fimbriimonadaceae bacterium]MCZ7580564.1 ABC transporter permease [Fimbriimonadaceae bacterium]QOJ12761.1 MAG: ABC transporter permease [Chthonomonadaceae bacterium]